MKPQTSRKDYKNHQYSGPRKSRKRSYGQMKRYHGEIKSRTEVWCKKNKLNDDNDVTSSSTTMEPVEIFVIKKEIDIEEERIIKFENHQEENEITTHKDNNSNAMIVNEMSFNDDKLFIKEASNLPSYSVERIADTPNDTEATSLDIKDESTSSYNYACFDDLATMDNNDMENIGDAVDYLNDNETLSSENAQSSNGTIERVELTSSIQLADSSPPVYNCSQCTIVCRNKASLSSHLRMHKKLLRKQRSIELLEKARKERAAARVDGNSEPEFQDPPNLKQKTRQQDHKYKCACGKGFGRKTSVEACLKTHDLSKVFLCQICLTTFKNGFDLAMHLKQCHDTWFPCKFCPAGFATRVMLYLHLQTHQKLHQTEHKVDEKTQFCCLFCSRCCEGISELKNHFVTAHKAPFVCPQCRKRFLKFTAFSAHTKIYHPKVQDESVLDVLEAFLTLNVNVDWKCEDCNKQFFEADKFALHGAKLHGPKVETSDRQLHCQDCRRVFFRQTDMNLHGKIHQSIENSEQNEEKGIGIHQSIENSEQNEEKGIGSHQSIENSEQGEKKGIGIHQSIENSEQNKEKGIGIHQSIENSEQGEKKGIGIHQSVENSGQNKEKGIGIHQSIENSGQNKEKGIGIHQSIENSEPNEEKGIGISMCLECQKIWREMSALASHMECFPQTGMYPTVRRLYDIRFAGSKKRRVRDKKAPTGVKPFVCYICDYRFATENLLIMHNRTKKHCIRKNHLLITNPLMKESTLKIKMNKEGGRKKKQKYEDVDERESAASYASSTMEPIETPVVIKDEIEIEEERIIQIKTENSEIEHEITTCPDIEINIKKESNLPNYSEEITPELNSSTQLADTPEAAPRYSFVMKIPKDVMSTLDQIVSSCSQNGLPNSDKSVDKAIFPDDDAMNPDDDVTFNNLSKQNSLLQESDKSENYNSNPFRKKHLLITKPLMKESTFKIKMEKEGSGKKKQKYEAVDERESSASYASSLMDTTEPPEIRKEEIEIEEERIINIKTENPEHEITFTTIKEESMDNYPHFDDHASMNSNDMENLGNDNEAHSGENTHNSSERIETPVYNCNQCTKVFGFKQVLQKHLSMHKKWQRKQRIRAIFKKCRMAKKKAVAAEIEDVPKSPDIKNKTCPRDYNYKCPCGKAFHRKTSMEACLRIHNFSEVMKFCCVICLKAFGTKDDLKLHRKLCHRKKRKCTDLELNKFCCVICLKTFGGEDELKLHRKLVHCKKQLSNKYNYESEHSVTVTHRPGPYSIKLTIRQICQIVT